MLAAWQKIVLEAVQEVPLRLALQMTRDSEPWAGDKHIYQSRR